MRLLAFFLLVVSAAALSASTARADSATVAIRPAGDVSLPFWCDWSYDWEARYYRDEGPRLPIGGVDDKVWRGALRFPLDQIPEFAAIVSARLRLQHDGTCVTRRLETVRGSGPAFASSGFAEAWLRPRLVVTYTTG